ncbi:hypothetical protein [uncultured Mucilaginibacter sp.]|nr:hypothetical protein [uncultured Mucilaginibacter sp.]
MKVKISAFLVLMLLTASSEADIKKQLSAANTLGINFIYPHRAICRSFS